MFSKLDHSGAYNLIQISEGDKWKMVFNTCDGHYEYLVNVLWSMQSPSHLPGFFFQVCKLCFQRPSGSICCGIP